MTKKEKENLVKENWWVVTDVINRYTHLMERDELEAAGLLGLAEGIDKFKEGKGAKLSTYVRHWVKARVLAAVYENRSVHVPWNKIHSYMKAQKDNPEEVGISGHNLSVSYTPKFEISLDAYTTNNNDFMHTCIFGPPGTGKTEIAKLLGHIYSKTYTSKYLIRTIPKKFCLKTNIKK